MAHFPNKDLKLRPDNGGNRYRHNILTYLPNDTVSNPEDRNFGTLPHKNYPPHIFFARLLQYRVTSKFSVT